MLLNLIKNALKFTSTGTIEVKLAYLSDSKTLIGHVRDTGAGIAAEDLPKLFSRFGKLHRTAAMNHEGIGLGLTIVKEIVKLCKGSIDVKSDGIDKGSTFRFFMRMDQACEEPANNDFDDAIQSEDQNH